LLEMVQVGHDQREGLAGAVQFFEEVREHPVEVAAVCQAGERVAVGDFTDLAKRTIDDHAGSRVAEDLDATDRCPVVIADGHDSRVHRDPPSIFVPEEQPLVDRTILLHRLRQGAFPVTKTTAEKVGMVHQPIETWTSICALMKSTRWGSKYGNLIESVWGESTSSAGRRMVSDIRVKRSSIKALTEANSSLAPTSRPALLKRSSSCRDARAFGFRKW